MKTSTNPFSKIKTLVGSLMVGGLIFASNTMSIAQTKEEHHAKLSEYHKKAQEHASKSVEGASASETHAKNAEEAGKHLEYAKTSHNDLKNAMPEKHKAIAKPHHEAIEKHHIEATKHHKAWKDEAAKAKYDEMKVKEHAKNFHTSVGNAEKEHQALKAKTAK